MNKRSMAVELLSAFGRYMEDAPNHPYHIRLNGKFLCSGDTADLADQVVKQFRKVELVGLMDTIPRED